MKRAAIMIAVPGAVLGAVLAMCSWSLGQSNDKPAAQNPPAGQAVPPAGQAAAPAGKRPPKVTSQEEFTAYKAAAALTDAPGLEKASDDFAAKYPESELRPLLYRSAMQRYQQANNGDKMLEMAKKVVAIDPDDPEALVGIAQVLAERWIPIFRLQVIRPSSCSPIKVSCGRKRTRFSVSCPPTLRIGRRPKRVYGSRSTPSPSRWIPLRCCDWRSRSTCRTRFQRP